MKETELYGGVFKYRKAWNSGYNTNLFMFAFKFWQKSKIYFTRVSTKSTGWIINAFA